jgi:ribosomal protein L16 Arg81 hydroxylase
LFNHLQIYHQKAGETLYVPSGWIHQVINHRPNMKIVWDFLKPKMLDHYVWTLEHISTKLFDPDAGQPGDCSIWSTWMKDEIQEFAKECPAFMHSTRVRLRS